MAVDVKEVQPDWDWLAPALSNAPYDSAGLDRSPPAPRRWKRIAVRLPGSSGRCCGRSTTMMYFAVQRKNDRRTVPAGILPRRRPSRKLLFYGVKPRSLETAFAEYSSNA